MSTHDDKAKAVTVAGGQVNAAASPETDQSGPGGPIILFFIIGFAASLILGWVVFPKLLYSQKDQPINFNHALHVAEVDDGCQSCHYFREDGSFSGVPKLANCVDCHEEVMGETAEEARFVAEFVQKDREVPWLIYSKQPACVYFSHAPHVISAKMDCVACHGHIGTSTETRVYEENRITGYSRDIWGPSAAGFKKNSWDRMKMDDCAACHREENVKQTSVQTEKGGCFVCHK